MAERLIPRDKSVIIAADIKPDKLIPLVKATGDVEGISGYKIGISLGLRLGLPETVRIMREHTNKKLTYDHQKAATDIPDMGKEFAEIALESGVDEIILFPQAGPVTEESWIKAAQDKGINVICGGEMTHPSYLVKEGGYIADDAPDRMYELAAKLGIREFVVPGNRVERVAHYRELIQSLVGNDRIRFKSPGFVTQDGKIADFAEVAGQYWDAIVGRAITAATDMRAAAELMTAQII